MEHKMVAIGEASHMVMEGWLFAGTIPREAVPENHGFLAVLENPASSGRMLRIQTVILTAAVSRPAELRFNVTPGAPLTPGIITNLNTRFLNRMSRARLGFVHGPNVMPSGQLILTLLTHHDKTTIFDAEGRIVLASGSNLGLFLPPVDEPDTVSVTFIFTESGMTILQNE